MTVSDIELHAIPSIAGIAAADWDACANPQSLADPDVSCPFDRERYNPFISHKFFLALEASKSASTRSGWAAQHLVAKRNSQIVGVVPCYLKSHSRGEYVFDAGWADAYQRAGGDYYPKLQVSVPFTPATGPRLLVRNDIPDAAEVRQILATGLKSLCKAAEASSVHVTFTKKDEWDLLAAEGFLQRTDQQFHWQNDGYATFDDFLGALNSRHRKAIKRERRDALANGVTIELLTGSDLTEDAFDAFFQFYMETGSRKWGTPYLNRDFYARIAESMPDDILLVMANATTVGSRERSTSSVPRPCSAATGARSSITPFCILRFATIRRSTLRISRRLKHVEAGAQGEHKLARGYLPRQTYSAHFIPDAGFRRAVADYLKRERQYVEHAVEELTEVAPFKKGVTE